MTLKKIEATDIINDALIDRLFPQKLRDELGALGATSEQIDAVKLHVATAYLDGVLFGINRISEAVAAPAERAQ